MKISNKFKAFIIIFSLFGFFINFTKAMTLNDFKLEESAKSEEISENLRSLDGFEKLNFFLRKDCNFEFFIKTLELAREKLTKLLLEKCFTDNSEWFADPELDFFSQYAQRSVEKKCKIMVIGDLHGNYDALSAIIKNFIKRRILSKDLKIKDGYKIVSLGDYIDRGKGSPQVLTLLIILKLMNPEQYIMLKGNHETKESVTSIIANLNVNKKPSIEYLKHYDFVANILKSFFKKKSRNFKSENDKKFFINVRDLFIDFFSLLPTVFYLQVNDKTFMFNHGGYSQDYLFANQVLPQFLNSAFKYATLEFEGNEDFDARQSLLCGDIYPENIFKRDLCKNDCQIVLLQDELESFEEYLDPDFPEEDLEDQECLEDQIKELKTKLTNLKEEKVRSFIKGSRGGFTGSDLYVSELMKSAEITAKFFGHTHELIKRVYYYENGNDSDIYRTYNDGFMGMGTRETPIFNLMSAEINSSPLKMKYKPSYLELIVDQNDWYIWGNSLKSGAKEFEFKLVPYCYNL